MAVDMEHKERGDFSRVSVLYKGDAPAYGLVDRPLVVRGA